MSSLHHVTFVVQCYNEMHLTISISVNIVLIILKVIILIIMKENQSRHASM